MWQESQRNFSKHDIPVHFKPKNPPRQRLLHPKDRTPKHKLSAIIYAEQCREECTDLYVGETEQQSHKNMAQHRRATSSGPDPAGHLHLKENGHSRR